MVRCCLLTSSSDTVVFEPKTTMSTTTTVTHPDGTAISTTTTLSAPVPDGIELYYWNGATVCANRITASVELIQLTRGGSVLLKATGLAHGSLLRSRC